jgi:hypothetical protein
MLQNVLGSLRTNKNEVRDEIRRKALEMSVIQFEKLVPFIHSKMQNIRVCNFPSFTYGCEKWFVTLREEPKLQDFEKKNWENNIRGKKVAAN